MTHDDLAARIDEVTAKLTDAIDVMRAELLGRQQDAEQKVSRGFAGINLRVAKIEEEQLSHRRQLAVHDEAISRFERLETKVEAVHQAIKLGFANMAALIRSGGQ